MVRFLLVFILLIVAEFLSSRIYNKYVKLKGKSIQSQFLYQIFRILLVIGAVVLLLMSSKLGKQYIKYFIASSGCILAVLGLAARESLSNVISGFILILSNPFNVGDKITIAEKDLTGIVKKITPRHVILKTYNARCVILTNTEINKLTVINYNLVDNDPCSDFVNVSVSFDTDLDKTIHILENCLKQIPLILPTEQKSPDIIIREFEDSGIPIRITVWTKTVQENFKACSDLRKEIIKEFRENNIEIPFNTITVLENNIKK